MGGGEGCEKLGLWRWVVFLYAFALSGSTQMRPALRF